MKTQKKKGKAPHRRRADGLVDIHRALKCDMIEILGVSGEAIRLWCMAGCPSSPDGTYDIPAVVQWRMQQILDRAASTIRGDLEIEKLRLDCQLKTLAIAEQEGKVYPRDFVHSIAAQQATALREFWQTGWRREAGGIAQQLGLPASSIPALVGCLENLVIEMMERWCDAGREITESDIRAVQGAGAPAEPAADEPKGRRGRRSR